MGILRSSQDELVSLKHVQKARVAFHDGGNNFDDELQYRGKRIGGGNALTNRVQDIYVLMPIGRCVSIHTPL